MQTDMEKKILASKPWYILMPDHPFKNFWNVLMIILLIYVVSYVPISISFIDASPDNSCDLACLVDTIVDYIFGCDMFVNFISAYEDPYNENLPVVNCKRISCNYLTGWFGIDFIAIFPTGQFQKLFTPEDESGSSNLKIARLARLPRLYRMIRLMRMLKLLRVFRKTSSFKDYLQSLGFSTGIMRLINVLVGMLILVHLMACLWYL